MTATLAAVLQDSKRHSYCVRRTPAVRYSVPMQDEQRAIVRWMESVLAEKGWSPEMWATAAGIAPTSITRAMKDDYKYVSKRQTVVKLAEAAGVPPPPIAGMAIVSSTINAENLQTILGTVLPLAPRGRISEPSLKVLSEALAYGLELLGDQISKPASDDVLKTVSRAIASRFREIGQGS